MKKAIFSFLIFFALLLISGAGYFYHSITTPASAKSLETIVRINHGQSFKSIATQLHSKDLIRNEMVFYFLGRLTGQARDVKAGHYQLDPSWSMVRILDHLTIGREALNRIQIPEGLSWWQTGRLLEHEGLVDFEEFSRLVNDQDFLEGLGVHGKSAEGFLFPETYYLSPTRDIGARRLISIMIGQFWKSTGHLWEQMDFDEVYQTINLASLVEKETGISAERRIVSGVFHNRIQKNMLLQCDPTIIYGLGEEFEGRLRRSHLEDRDNPYNTYRHRGFPPTPICSPGLASIKAALFPEEHNYLYFVSRNDGSHHFSKTLQEHNRAVNRYQRGR
ncbi:endolytic transglycosylase MltG [Desulfonatronovibrio hydrogenovorans]|uniref:endolytic transglycosylase MltG n=1 Tax=Desulfonatronovibrio hydrogenovorans TaxID=53245 RepID=UPI00068E060E|nr:endolytic transglycosylase MltG [Desulfonatronovibrio hydrogenovorans]